jgi:flagellar motor switch protein FliM
MNPTTPPAPSPESAPTPGGVSVLNSRGVRETRPASEIRHVDFRQSGFLAPSELRRIRLRHEQLVRSMAARLAIFLRLEFTVELGKLQIVGYQKFLEGLPSPTHITLFKTDPLKGVGLLVIPPRLGLTIVDRLLGGSGQKSDQNRDLSELETALSDQAAMIVLSEWCGHWHEMRDLRPAILGHESNSRFLQTAPADTAMLIITLNAGLGDPLQPVHLAFPYATIEPLVRLLCPAGLPHAVGSPPADAGRPKWNREFDGVPVPLTAEWKGLKLSAGDITRLKPGDVLMLDPACAAQVELRLSHITKFLGRPGTRSGRWAVQLTAPMPA